MSDSINSIRTTVWEKWEGLTPDSLSNYLLFWVYIRFTIYVVVCALQCRIDYIPGVIPAELRDHITQEQFENGRKYRLTKTIFQMCTFLYILFVIHLFFMKLGILYILWQASESIMAKVNFWPFTEMDPEYGLSVIYIIIGVTFLNSVEILPLVCDTIIEELFGFNRQTWKFFVKDWLSKDLMHIIVSLPIGLGVVAISKNGGNYFFLWLWLFAFLMLAFFISIYPVLIAPYFDSYSKLAPGPLRTRLEHCANKFNFPVDDILILKESHRTIHYRAYFFGFGQTKRIVLSDNLLRHYIGTHTSEDVHMAASRDQFKQAVSPSTGCSEEEIEALVAHEISHWVQNHVLWDMAVGITALFIQFLCFWWLHTESKLYEAFDFPSKSKKPILVGFFIIYNHILDTVNYVINLLLKKFSRVCDYRADAFAVRHGYGEPLKSAIIKVQLDNLQYPYFNYFYIMYFHSSPSVLRRLRHIDRLMRHTH